MSRRVAWLSVPATLLVGWSALFTLAAQTAAPARAQQPRFEKRRKVEKTDAEWRKLLTPLQYQVTRLKETEPAFSGKYAHSKAAGTYYCVGCEAPLFSSKAKFESGTGWPSFFQPIGRRAVDTTRDYELGYLRVEVVCNDCGAHLGHVFDDGPPPTGLRYCMNSAALKFLPQGRAVPTVKEAEEKEPGAVEKNSKGK